MSNINVFAVSGNLTRDIEVREFGDGGKVGNTGVAVNRSFKKGDEFVKEVSFFDVTIWGNFADLCQRKLKKGDPVSIKGRLKQDTWETDTGDKRSKVVLIAEEIDSEGFFRSKDEDNAPGASTPDTAAPAAAPAADSTDDDIPF